MGCTTSTETIYLTKSISIVLRNNKNLDLIADSIKALQITSIEQKSHKQGGGLNPSYYNF